MSLLTNYQNQFYLLFRRLLQVVFILVIGVVFSINSYAISDVNAINQLIKTDNAEQTSKVEETDSYHRFTPYGTANGLYDAIQKEDINLLEVYLNPNFVKKNLVSEEAKVEFIKKFSTLLNKHAVLDPKQSLSKKPTGKLDDGLSERLEVIGSLKLANSPPILLERIKTESKTQRWVLSRDFSKNVAKYHQNIEPELIDKWLPSDLNKSVFGISIGHFFTSLVLLLMVFAAGVLVSTLVLFLIKGVFSITKNHPFSPKRLLAPLAIIFASSFYPELMNIVGIERPTQEITLPVVYVLGILSLGLLLYRIIDKISQQFDEQTSYKQKLKGNLSIVYLLKGIAKAGVIVLTFFLMLNIFGVNLSAGVALLGFGGLALALGAQKMVENFVGSIVVVADKPIDIGDYCRFGETEGTIEDIGIRSTRIRTLTRTLVTIPNGKFSSIEIENYSKRDRFLFNHCFAFGLNISKGKLQNILNDMRSLLANRDDLYQPDSRVRLRYTERDCFKIEVVCYVLTNDFLEFLEVQEDLLLALIDMINHSTVDLALPVQLIHDDNA